MALFAPCLFGGGAERVMLTLAGEFARRGAAVDLVLARAEGPLLPFIPAGVRLVDLRLRATITSVPRLLRYLRRERPAALLATLHAAEPALVARRFAGGDLRVVVRYANTFSREFADSGWRRKATLTLLKRLLPGADAVIAVSRRAAADLRRSVPRAAHLVRALPSPIVVPEIAAQARAPVEHPWFADSRAPIVLAAGRLARQKDQPTLLRAFAALAASRDARLVVLGEGPERAKLAALGRRLGIAGRVDFPGWVANPYAHMARAAVFVQSSTYEGLPLTLVEAMACGTPVVSTDCPSGPREILEDGRYGRLTPPGDWRALADAVARTLDAAAAPEPLIARADAWSAGPSADRYLETMFPS